MGSVRLCAKMACGTPNGIIIWSYGEFCGQYFIPRHRYISISINCDSLRPSFIIKHLSNTANFSSDIYNIHVFDGLRPCLFHEAVIVDYICSHPTGHRIFAKFLWSGRHDSIVIPVLQCCCDRDRGAVTESCTSKYLVPQLQLMIRRSGKSVVSRSFNRFDELWLDTTTVRYVDYR